MILLWLVLLGMLLGSFVNALVWRIHKQAEITRDGTKKKLSANDRKLLAQLSITKGRSMCSRCGHALAPKDLVPVLSWLYLRGRCRYCKKSIGDSPLAEIILPILFILSYNFWPYGLIGQGFVELVAFGVWLLVLTIGLALAIYDARWYLLPDRLVIPLTLAAMLMVLIVSLSDAGLATLLWALAGGSVVSGLFYMLFQVSKGEWIGGGDVKIGFALGLVAGTPLMACLVIFIASLLGMVLMMPSIIRRKSQMKTMLPFGPFLLAAAVIVFLWGSTLFGWYQSLLTA